MEPSETVETRRVEIQQGWLINQFAEHVLRYGPGQSLTPGDYETLMREINPEFAAALRRFDALVAQKNYQYDSSWQTLGEIIPTADMIDKLARLSGAWRNGAALNWDPDKRRGVLFDLIVRAFMILAWEGLNFQDDDDDRPPNGLVVNEVTESPAPYTIDRWHDAKPG